MLERGSIESRNPEDLAEELRAAFDHFCAPASSAAAG
jgi:hypothetical protein